MHRVTNTHQPIHARSKQIPRVTIKHLRKRQTRQLLYAAATLSLIAALIHIWVMPEHTAEWWGYGLFFLIVAMGQALYSIAVLCTPRPWIVLLGIAGNLAIIAFYLVTRTVGIPFFGPNAGEREAVGPLDLGSKVIELVLVIVLLAVWKARRQRRSAAQSL